MTVRELIDLLNQVPDDIQVAVSDPGCGCCGSGYLIADKAETVEGLSDGRGGVAAGTESQKFFKIT